MFLDFNHQLRKYLELDKNIYITTPTAQKLQLQCCKIAVILQHNWSDIAARSVLYGYYYCVFYTAYKIQGDICLFFTYVLAS